MKIRVIFYFLIFFQLINISKADQLKSKETKELYSVISSLFEKKEYKKIIDFYEENYNIEPSLRAKIIIGESYRIEGNFEKSISILESISSNEINIYLKTKIELALSYYGANDYEKTIEEIDNFFLKYEKKPNSNESESGEKLINYLNTLKSNATFKKEKADQIFHGFIGASYGYDSNPNFTNRNSVYNAQLSLYSNKSYDFGLSPSGNINYNYNFNRNWSIFGFVYANYMRYNETEKRNNLMINGSQGFAYKYNKWKFGAIFNYSSFFFGQDGIYEFDTGYLSMSTYSVVPYTEYDFNKYVSSKTMIQTMCKDIHMGATRNNVLNAAIQQFQFRITNYTSIMLGGMAGYERSSLAQYNNFIYNANILFRQHIPNFPVYFDLSFNYTKLSFTNLDPMFNLIRQDSFYNAGISIHYLISKYFDTYVSYFYSKNISNVSLYKFNRNLASIGFKIVF